MDWLEKKKPDQSTKLFSVYLIKFSFYISNLQYF